MTPDETDQYDLTDDNKGQRTIAVRAWENYRRDLNITLSLPNIPSGGRGGDDEDRVMIQDYDQIGLAVLDGICAIFFAHGRSSRVRSYCCGNAPRYRAMECHGSIYARPVLAGLHHHYARIK